MLRALTVLLLLPAGQDAKVKEVKGLAYYEGEGADAKKHKLDLYLPESEKPFPVLMWIHGGAWATGDRALYGGVGRQFAIRGIAFAAISYRLSPGVKHPEHVKDCARAFAWLVENAKKHGGDPDRLFVSGQSAGGHLSALLTLDRKYLDDLKVPADAIKGTVPMSGVYTIPPLAADTKGFMQIFPKAFGSDPEACRDASPTAHVSKARVPMLVLTETDDNYKVRAGMELFKAALGRAGFKDVSFKDAEGRNHISIVTRMAQEGEDVSRDAIVEFVTKRCKELQK
jgi:acetyl esterase/lipase